MKKCLALIFCLFSLYSIGQNNTTTILDSCSNSIDVALKEFSPESIKKVNTHLKTLLVNKEQLTKESKYYYDSTIDYQLSLFKTEKITQEELKEILYILIHDRHQYLADVYKLLELSTNFIAANHHEANYNEIMTLVTVMNELTEIKRIKKNLDLHR